VYVLHNVVKIVKNKMFVGFVYVIKTILDVFSSLKCLFCPHILTPETFG